MGFYAGAVLVPLIAAALVPFFDRFGARARDLFAVIAGFATAILTLALIPHIRQGSGLQVEWLPGLVKVGVNLDALSVNMAVIAGVIGSLIVLYSTKYLGEEGAMRYYSFTLLFIGAMIGLVLSDNFLMLYIFWEIVGLCSYALIGFFYKDPKAVNAGIKAFMTTRVGDVGLLIGILILYTATRTFSINQTIAQASTIPQHLLFAAAFLFMLGAIGKSAQAPLHVWLPDAMEAPTSTSALIHAATMVNAGIYLMARTFPLFSAVPGWMTTLAWIGVATAFLSASMALVERDIKRILAFSTVSQLGYMMFAIGVGGLFASQYHLLSHAVFKALLFLSAGAIIHAVHTRDIYEMGGLLKSMKLTSACFIAGALSLMGIPLFNGFFSKDMIFASALAEKSYLPLSLAILTAVITILYTLRMFNRVFLGDGKNGHDAPWEMSLPLVILAAGTVTTWLLAPALSHLMASSGIHVGQITFIELIKEIITGPTLVISLCIILAGFGIFYMRNQTVKTFSIFIDPYLYLAKAGFGFDMLYQKIIGWLFSAGSFVNASFDEGTLNRFNYLLGDGFVSFSRVFRLTHTGQLNMNLVGMVLGFAAILCLVLWR